MHKTVSGRIIMQKGAKGLVGNKQGMMQHRARSQSSIAVYQVQKLKAEDNLYRGTSELPFSCGETNGQGKMLWVFFV